MKPILAVDYGTRRFGLATSDPDGRFAMPLEPYLPPGTPNLDELARRIVSHDPLEVVVGLPLRLDGTEGDAAAAVREFAADLADRLPCPVRLWDERHTSDAARALLRDRDASRERKREITNSVAAQILLQAYLDFRKTP